MPRVARPACLFANSMENGEDFTVWMQSIMNADFTENQNPPSNAIEVALKTGGRPRRVLATCCVAFEDDLESPENMHDENTMPVRLVFSDIREPNGSSSSSNRHKRRGTPSRSQRSHLDRHLSL
mmetsp:Transcript_56361/g.112018  ORF Transcript_56361/g.112018 Transcript_56361/m.112018 type:complete len:124 (+) Transcript_56361:3-374(+)